MTLEEAIEYTLSCGKGASILSKLFSASKKPLATDIDVARNALLPEEDVLFSISTLTKVGSTGGSLSPIAVSLSAEANPLNQSASKCRLIPLNQCLWKITICL